MVLVIDDLVVIIFGSVIYDMLLCVLFLLRLFLLVGKVLVVLLLVPETYL